MTFLKNHLAREPNHEVWVIVSGLPRSGTSMMMQMLEAGGMEIVTDNIRKADEDNPRGYYELEKVKNIKNDSTWLDACRGKAFKMISALLYHLPKDKGYKVIFMKRDTEEMLASQKLMLQRLGQKDDGVGDKKMGKKVESHLRTMEDWLKKQPHIEVIYVSYNEAIQNPIENASLVNLFLGGWLNEEEMVNVVTESLYRKRKERI